MTGLGRAVSVSRTAARRVHARVLAGRFSNRSHGNGIYVGRRISPRPIDAELGIAALPERVTVNRTPSVIDRQSTAIKSPASNAGAARETCRAREACSPFLTATPAVQVARFEVGGNTGDAGSPYSAYGTLGANRPMVEGINIAGVQATGFTFDYGSFEEVSVLHGRAHRRVAEPGRADAVHRQVGGQPVSRDALCRLREPGWQSFNIDEDQIARGARGGGGLLAPRCQPSVELSRRQCGHRRLYQERTALWWYSSVRDQDVAARQSTFPVEAASNASDELQRQGHVSGHTRTTRSSPTARRDGIISRTAWIPSASTAVASLRRRRSTNRRNRPRAARLGLGRGRVNGTRSISDKAFFEIRAGQFGADRHEKPNGSAPRFEDIGTLIVRGGNRDWQMQTCGATRCSGRSAISRMAGSGTIISRAAARSTGPRRPKSGGRAIQATCCTSLRNERSARGVPVSDAVDSESGLWAYAAYASDSWRLNNRLTLNLGLRFDRYRVFLPEQEHPAGGSTRAAQTFAAVDNVIDWNVLAPRHRRYLRIWPATGGRS